MDEDAFIFGKEIFFFFFSFRLERSVFLNLFLVFGAFRRVM